MVINIGNSKFDMSKYESRKLEVIIMVKKFDWKIWAKKLSVNLVVIVIAGLASVYGDNPYYLVVAPALLSLQNFLKHKYGISL